MIEIQKDSLKIEYCLKINASYSVAIDSIGKTPALALDKASSFLTTSLSITRLSFLVKLYLAKYFCLKSKINWEACLMIAPSVKGKCRLTL